MAEAIFVQILRIRPRSKVPNKSYAGLLFLFVLLLLLTGKEVYAESNRLRIATWNLQWLRPDYQPGSTTIRSERDYQGLKQIFESIAPDIMAVQEVASADLLARIAAPDQYQAILEDRDSDQRTGFLIRKNIFWTRHQDVSLNFGHRGLRQGTHIELSYNGRPIHLLSVHLATGCWEGSVKSSQKGCLRLKRQMPVLNQWLEKYGSEKSLAIALGDFNRRLSNSGEFWEGLSQSLPSNNTLSLFSPTLGKNSLCSSHQKPAKLIDHILLFGPPNAFPQSYIEHIWSKEEQNQLLLSDHCPLFVDL